MERRRDHETDRRFYGFLLPFISLPAWTGLNSLRGLTSTRATSRNMRVIASTESGIRPGCVDRRLGSLYFA